MQSGQLLSLSSSAVLLVDAQAKLMPLIVDADRLVLRARLLLDAARMFDVPILSTEQYPAGLGRTVETLADFAESPVEKLAFSAAEPAVLGWLHDCNAQQVVLLGIEAHVCVLQTAFDLQANGFRPYIVADAVGSRREADREAALARFVQFGMTVTTAETAAFEWARSAEHPKFRQLSWYVKSADEASRRG